VGPDGVARVAAKPRLLLNDNEEVEVRSNIKLCEFIPLHK